MNEVTPGLEPVKILWTGGWDSTFQLLRLLLLENRRVEPYYLIDEDRLSAGTELLTMKRIRKKIRDVNEPAAALMQPTKFFSVSEIPSNSRITQAYETIKEDRFIGRQHEWIARFCEDQGISGIQLCIHKDDPAAVVVVPIVTSDQQNKHSFKVDGRCFETDEYRLFKYFEFPILKLTKTDIAQIAKEHGWTQIMEMTWFCHKPINGKPCGLCNPCKYTIEEGLAWRIPTYRRLMGKVHRLLVQPANNLAKKISFALQQKMHSHKDVGKAERKDARDRLDHDEKGARV